jgi:hypothetical protein
MPTLSLATVARSMHSNKLSQMGELLDWSNFVEQFRLSDDRESVGSPWRIWSVIAIFVNSLSVRACFYSVHKERARH